MNGRVANQGVVMLGQATRARKVSVARSGNLLFDSSRRGTSFWIVRAPFRTAAASHFQPAAHTAALARATRPDPSKLYAEDGEQSEGSEAWSGEERRGSRETNPKSEMSGTDSGRSKMAGKEIRIRLSAAHTPSTRCYQSTHAVADKPSIDSSLLCAYLHTR
jgi:hypothetical protein